MEHIWTADNAMSGNKNGGSTRRNVIKTSGVALTAGVGALATIGSASASHNDEIDPGDIISLRNDGRDVPTYDNLELEGREEYISGTPGEVIKSEQAYQQTWYLADIYGEERWVAEGFVRHERDA